MSNLYQALASTNPAMGGPSKTAMYMAGQRGLAKDIYTVMADVLGSPYNSPVKRLGAVRFSHREAVIQSRVNKESTFEYVSLRSESGEKLADYMFCQTVPDRIRGWDLLVVSTITVGEIEEPFYVICKRHGVTRAESRVNVLDALLRCSDELVLYYINIER